MNDTIIVTSYSIIDDVLKACGHTDHRLAQAGDAEVLTVAVVAALYFHNHHERAVVMMNRLGYLSGQLSVSRFNRRIHRLADWLAGVWEILSELLRGGQLYLIDSLPVPVCKWVRGRTCRKVRGRLYYGKCGAKRENFFGWRLHLVFTPDGFPVSFELLPARCHDLTPIYQLLTDLPCGARVLGDKGYNAAADQACLLKEWSIHLIARPRSNMQPLPWPDDFDLRHYRLRIESFNSQLVNMGIQRLHARTRAGFDLKIQASLLALTFQHFN
jgi:hypothetical protein